MDLGTGPGAWTEDWLRCIEGPPGPTGGTQINVVNLSSRLMARWDEPEASLGPRSDPLSGCCPGVAWNQKKP